MKVSKRFTDWCEEYTRDMVQSSLNLFCSDGGSASKINPRRKEIFLQRYSGEPRPETTRRPSKRPKRKTTVNPNTRRKRFITAAIVIVVVVTSLVGAYFLGNAASGTSSNAAEVIKQNLENTKRLALETEEIRKQVEDVMKQINVTMSIVSEMKEQLEAIQMEANILNQATVASIVSRYEWLSNNIRLIGSKGKCTPNYLMFSSLLMIVVNHAQ